MHITNPKARAFYQIDERLEAGVELTGAEVKSLRLGRGSLKESFVAIRGGEAWLLNFQIPPYSFTDGRTYQPTRTRRLLLHRREITRLETLASRKGAVLLPLAVYLKKGKFKVEVGVGRGKKLYERREELKRRDIERETQRELKRFARVRLKS